MNIYNINQAMGLIDDDLIEAAFYPSEPKAKTAKTAFFAPDFARRPWMKYAVAAAAFIVVLAGALVAVNVTGAWRNDNLVPPNSGTETPGVITPAGSDGDSENPGSVPGSEGTPVINGDSSQNGGNSGSENHGGQGSETPGKPDGTQTPPAEEPEVVIEGDFLKNDMPAVTYRIAGESRTFVYQKSSVVKTSESGDGKPTYSVIDRYADPAGATLSVNADTGDLIRYDSNANQGFKDSVISEEEALETARLVVGSTAIISNVIESVHAATRYSDGCYYVGLTYAEGSIEVCLDKTGELLYLYIISVT